MFTKKGFQKSTITISFMTTLLRGSSVDERMNAPRSFTSHVSANKRAGGGGHSRERRGNRAKFHILHVSLDNLLSLTSSPASILHQDPK
jgi:hypothetical protein